MSDVLPPLTDAELRPYLDQAFADRGGIVSCARRPYEYRTSYPLDAIVVETGNFDTLTVLYKDLRWGALPPAVKAAKPKFLYNPRREITVYRDLIGGIWAPGDPDRFVAIEDDDRGYFGFIMPQADGRELYQHGDLTAWQDAARWLAEWHQMWQPEVLRLPAQIAAQLINYNRDFLVQWRTRAWEFRAHRISASTRVQLSEIVRQHERAVDLLVGLPVTLVHGEFYASNVFVEDSVGPPYVVEPVDWELAGIGPGLLDLAALTSGKWTAEERAKIVAAYCDVWARDSGTVIHADFAQQFLAARLHLAVQWLGWSETWQPPAHQQHDWFAEAVNVAAELASF